MITNKMNVFLILNIIFLVAQIRCSEPQLYAQLLMVIKDEEKTRKSTTPTRKSLVN